MSRSSMSSFLLILRNIQLNAFRSWVIFLCSAVLAGFAVSATLFVTGAQESLRLAANRLGADIIVVPANAAPMMEHAFLMGVPASFWMPVSALDEIRAVEGVAEASPQLYLSTLRGATCCSLPEMFLVAYDPESDFTLKPWLARHLEGGLGDGQAVGGRFVYVPSGQEKILVYGYPLDLVGHLDATGTGLDQSMFFTFETARQIAEQSHFKAEQDLVIPSGSVSSILVKVSDESDVQAVAGRIHALLPGLTPVTNANLFQTQRAQLLGMMKSILFLLAITWVLSTSLIGLVFSMTVNDRRREIGVLRALGATQTGVLSSLLTEAALLAVGGGLTGVVLTTYTMVLFKNLIVRSTELPFLMPAPLALVGWTSAGLALALLSIFVSSLFPVLRISRMEPAIAMRE